MPAACWLRVELDDPERADGFEVEDADGERMPLIFREGDVTFSRIAANIKRGRSDVVKVDERARTLVLFQGADEAGRVALELAPGEVTVIRP